ncbi:MAG TPA: hypothetical protein VFJ85_02825 [Acidimicrobiales bacterium]|nr:hypothetical protein [Acidimicrobiales bacterium]
MGERVFTMKFVGDVADALKALKQVDGGTETTKSKLGGVVKGAAFGALGALAVKFGKDSVGAFREAEHSQAELSAAYAKFPALADTNISELRKLNGALQQKTKFDDDATASAQSVLASFKLTGHQIEQLTPLLQDYAVRTGKDLPTSAEDLGKAILGQGRALKAVGVEFKDTGSTAGNFDQLMGSLRDKVGGFAEKEGKTAAGQAEILHNQFGELEEKVGSVLVPALTKLAGVLLGIVEWFGHLNPAVQTAIGVAAGLVVGVVAISKAIQAWTVVQEALDVVLTANPIGLVVVAIAALVAGIVLAYQHSETFRNIVQTAFGAVADAAVLLKDVAVGAFRTLVDFWLAEVEWIVKGAATAFGWVPGIGPKLREAAKAVEGFRDDVNAALGGLQDKTVNLKVIEHTERIGTGGLQARASGGPVSAGTPYVVGEEGRELFIPDVSGVIVPNGALVGAGAPLAAAGGTALHIEVNVAGSVTSERDLAATIHQLLLDIEKRNGPLWRN